MEIGARAEGLERLTDKLFGPEGYFSNPSAYYFSNEKASEHSNSRVNELQQQVNKGFSSCAAEYVPYCKDSNISPGGYTKIGSDFGGLYWRSLCSVLYRFL